MYFPNFASAEQCESIIELAREGLKPSTVLLRKGETEEDSKGIRTSSGVFKSAPDDETGILNAIEEKIAKATKIPSTHGEAFNILRYEVGQKYNAHYDAFDSAQYGPQKSQREMSRNFDMITAIDDSKETFKVAVRIVDLWFVQTREKSKHVEMVLMDGKKAKIHAIVKKEDLETWETELKEGKTYYMYNFRVVPNDGQYKVCQHPFKVFFTGGTTLRQVELPDIPLKSYEFKSFEDITNGKCDSNILIDIIGIVEEIKFQFPSANPPKVVFNIKDLSAQVISCTLWSDHATKFMAYLKHNDNLASMIIVLTQARIKPPQGIHALTISNSLYGSKLLINDEVPDFAIYRERLSTANLGEPSNLSQSVSLGQQSQGSEFSELDRFMYKCRVIDLSNIPDLADGSNICTVGTTSKLIAGKGGWFYNSCTKCTRKANDEDVAYTCSCGIHNQKSIPRYRVEVMLSHKKGSGNFVFWDRDCTHIIGMSAAELRGIMIKTEEGGPKHFPDPLDKLLGLTVAIKCKYQSKFNSYSVMRMSDDANIIKAITDQMCLLQEVGKISKLTSSETEVGETSLPQVEAVVQDNNASLSATAEHDPEQDTILTPTKRSSSQLSPDDPGVGDAASAQLSVTKLTKHIKSE